MTPCFHTFHLGCIAGWLSRRHECPTCRWDIRDFGEEQAMSSSGCARVPENLQIVVPGGSECKEIRGDESIKMH